MEKTNYKIIFIYIIIVILAALGGIYAKTHSIALSHMNFLEPFYSNNEPFQSYESCVGQFYPNWWCMRVPKQNEEENGYCRCGNGQMGTYQMGGKCFCYPNNPTFPYYTENKFFDYPSNN